MPFCHSSPRISQQITIKVHPIAYKADTIPCHLNLHCWLLALRELLQNTAWDKWRYKIGIGRAILHLLPATTTTIPHFAQFSIF